MQTVPADRREPRSARDYVDTAALRLASCRHDRSSALQSSRAPERSRGASSLPRRVMAGHPQVAEHSGRVPHRLGDLRTLVRRGQNRAARGRNTGQARRRQRGAVLRCAARRTRGKLGPRLLEARSSRRHPHRERRRQHEHILRRTRPSNAEANGVPGMACTACRGHRAAAVGSTGPQPPAVAAGNGRRRQQARAAPPGAPTATAAPSSNRQSTRVETLSRQRTSR